MATILLIIIYLGFISLGIPDSIFGAAWPAIYSELNLPISFASFVTVMTTLGTFISSLFSARLINRFGVNKVAAVSTILTAFSLIGFSFSNNIIFFCLLALPLGFGGGAIDSGLNNYVALHYKASQMNFLHCFYGIGVSLTPYLMSYAMAGDRGWRGGYRVMAFIQLSIALLLFATLPLWKKAHPSQNGEEELKPKNLSFKELICVPALPFAWMMFFASCALEFTTGIWSSTFLVDFKGADPSFAAKIVTLYYLGITLSRGLAGVVSSFLSGWKLIFLGLAEIIAAVIVLIFANNPIVIGAALFFIGFGNGPIYPALMHLTPKLYGAEVSQSVMSSQMSAASLGIMLAPALFGLLTRIIGVSAYPLYLAFYSLLLSAATILIVSNLKKNKKII